MRLNPFVAGNSVGNTPAFVGRADVFARVDDFLRKPAETGLLLFGQRRIGKTSILHHLRARLPGVGPWRPVFFDLQGRASASIDQIVGALATAIASALKIPAPMLGAAPQQEFADSWLPAVLAALPAEGRVVLLLDEFDVLANPLDSSATGLFAYLGSLLDADHRGRLATIYTLGRTMDDLEAPARFLLRGVRTVHVSTLTRSEFDSLLDLAERGEGPHWGAGARDAIWALTGGHPLLTQLIGSVLWSAAQQTGAREVSVANIQESVPAVLKEARNMLTWLWDGLTPACQIVASALAEHGSRSVNQAELETLLREIGVREVVSQLARASRRLCDWDLLDETEDRYSFKVELLRLWIRLHRRFATVREHLDQLVPAANELFETATRVWQSSEGDDATRAAQVVPILELILRDPHQNPNHVGAAILLAHIYVQQDRHEDALKVLERLYPTQPAAIRPHLVNLLLSWADALSEPALEEQRLQLFQRALELAPGSREASARAAEIWQQRGERERSVGRLEEALVCFRQAGATRAIEEVLQELSRQGALRELEEVRELVQERQFNRALERLDPARELLADLPEVEALRTELLRQVQIGEVFGAALAANAQGDAPKAIELLGRVLQLDPAHREAARELCSLLHPQGEQHDKSRIKRLGLRALALLGALLLLYDLYRVLVRPPPPPRHPLGVERVTPPLCLPHEPELVTLPPETLAATVPTPPPPAPTVAPEPDPLPPISRQPRPTPSPAHLRACNAGETQYCVMVGMFYELTPGASRDSRTQASTYYQQACLKDNADGCYFLSRIYEPHNKALSAEYQKKACRLGHQAACDPSPSRSPEATPAVTAQPTLELPSPTAPPAMAPPTLEPPSPTATPATAQPALEPPPPTHPPESPAGATP